MSEAKGASLRQRPGKKQKAKKDGGIEITRVEKKGAENKQEDIQRPVRPSKKPPSSSSSSTARIYETLAVVCLLLALLVGVAVYLLHYEPQIVKQLDEGFVKAAATIAQLFQPKNGPNATSKPVAKKAKVVSKIFSADELRLHNGSDPAKPILLSVLGKVFDVTDGKRFYAKGGSYSFFAGRDASRSFATGEFEEENLTDDVTDLEPEQVAAIKEWQTQFERQYKYLGKVVGRFYDAAGKATPALKKVKEKLQKAKIVVDQELEEKQQFPECNSRWTEKDGATVWCTESSGGIERSWKGYPRQFKSARAQNPRCACVRKKLLDDPRVRPYDGCSPDAFECQR